MSINNLLLPVGVALFAVVLVRSEVSLKFLKGGCIVHNSSIVENVTCSAKAVNRTTTLINMDGVLIRQVNDPYINLRMLKKTTVSYRPFLINLTESYCDYFAKNRGSAHLRMIMSIYLPYTNLNHTCPYNGHVFLRDLPVNSKTMEALWPVGTYLVEVLISEKTAKIITLQFFLEVKERFNLRL